MDPAQLQFTLGELPFLAGLPEGILGQLARISNLVEFPAGRVIFREGAANDRLYLLVRGRVALEMCMPARGCSRIMTLGPGDMLGWTAVLGGGPMTSTAIALSDCTLVAAAGATLRELSERDHEFGFRLMRRMADALSRRLVATRLQLLDLYSEGDHEGTLQEGQQDEQ